jgi:mevalonate kinase
MSRTAQLRGNGKLLITGEYAVLHGAKALAIPCRFGQSFEFVQSEILSETLDWFSYNMYGECWFSGTYSKNNQRWVQVSDITTGARLASILQFLSWNNSPFLCKISTHLDYPAEWGLGSSSTLIWALGNYFNVDSFAINRTIFKGSGYDIACAGADTPIYYHLNAEGNSIVEPTSWNPSFEKDIHFVYLGKKQSSLEALNKYQKQAKPDGGLIEKISQLSENLQHCLDNKEQCISILDAHEVLMSEHLKQPRIQHLYFSDFNGVVKSLGAWGGDFVMAVSRKGADSSYFYEKGYTTVIPFSRMLKSIIRLSTAL